MKLENELYEKMAVKIKAEKKETAMKEAKEAKEAAIELERKKVSHSDSQTLSDSQTIRLSVSESHHSLSTTTHHRYTTAPTPLS